MAGPPFPSSIAIIVCCCCCCYSCCFFFFDLTTSSSLMIHIYLYMGLMIWFCKWVWWVWDLGLRKPYGFDELRSRSRICLMILMICLELIICIEEIEMEESQVEKGEKVDKKRENMTWEVREKIIKKIKYKTIVTMHICTVTSSKCANMHTFKSTDVEHFLGKMCKICVFLYYAKVYIHWCRCS